MVFGGGEGVGNGRDGGQVTADADLGEEGGAAGYDKSGRIFQETGSTSASSEQVIESRVI